MGTIELNTLHLVRSKHLTAQQYVIQFKQVLLYYRLWPHLINHILTFKIK